MPRRLFILLMLSCAAYAQTAAPTGVPGSLQGRVTDSQTGNGLGGASLHLFPTAGMNSGSLQPYNTVSLDDGSFRFDSVSPGTYILFANHPDYVNGGTNAQRVSIGNASQLIGVAVQLNPLGSISGKVLDPAGRPAAGTDVELFIARNVRGKVELRRMQNGSVSSSGAYLFKKVIPGKYYIAASTASRHATRNSTAEQSAANVPETEVLSTVRTFYPKATTVEDASLIDLAAGVSIPDVDIHLQQAETFRIQGKIASLLPGVLQTKGTLELAPRDSAPRSGLGRMLRSKDDGSFSVDGVPSGSYTLWLIGSYGPGAGQNRRYGRRRVLAREDVDVNGSNVNDIVLSLMPPVNLTGNVVLMNAPANANVSQLRVNLQPSSQTEMGVFQSIAVDADGEFSVQDLEPGEYMVRVVNVPTGMYLQSVMLNRQDVTTSGIDFSQGGGGELEVTLKTGVAEVDGTLAATGDNAPASGTALLVPQTLPADGSGVLTARVTPGGTFAIPNVPPGRYLAFAVQQWTSIWQNVDFLREMEREGTSVEVQENTHAQVALPLLTQDQLQLTASRLGLSAQ